MNRLEDKVAIVTGSSRGIGKAVAIEFARQGAHLVVGAVTDLQAAQEVTDAIRAMGRQAFAAIADVSKRAEVDDLVQAALGRFGKVDILVNNAGIISPSPLLQLTESQWDRTMEVHLKGTFNCTQAVALHMKETGGGKIINRCRPVGATGIYAGRGRLCGSQGRHCSIHQDCSQRACSISHHGQLHQPGGLHPYDGQPHGG